MSANSVIAGMMVVLSAATASIDTAIENAIPVTQTVTGAADKNSNQNKTPRTQVVHTTTVTPEEAQGSGGDHGQGEKVVEEAVNEDTPTEPGNIPGVSLEEEYMFDKLAECESGGDWHINTGNSYYGGIQFDHNVFLSVGGAEFAPRADLATREEQIILGKRLKDKSGWGNWPSCSARLGFR